MSRWGQIKEQSAKGKMALPFDNAQDMESPLAKLFDPGKSHQGHPCERPVGLVGLFKHPQPKPDNGRRAKIGLCVNAGFGL